MKKQRRKYDEVNYWEPMADSMVGLLLCILLIALLLILYLVRIPEDDYLDLEEGNSYEQYDDAEKGVGNRANGRNDDEEGDDWEQEEPYDNDGGFGGSGGGGEDGEEDEKYKFEDPDPGAGEGEGTDKAAVFVQLVDGETGRTIKKKGIEFELYGSNSALQVLSTYYPKKTDYKKYETDESGVFYFPEKLFLARYYLHELTTVPGYDIADNVEFTIDASYDWNDPYVVTVPINPSKNIIRMKLVDKDDGTAVKSASFDVVAAENIVTQDGTTRYKEGEIVDTIMVDNEGYGESKDLYLGDYYLRQNQVPEYYAKLTADIPVTAESKNESGSPGIKELAEEKTSVTMTLVDALYDTVYLADARFTMTSDDGNIVKNIKTDDKGRFTLTNLKKNTTYHIRQLTTVKDYQVDNADYSFTVNGDGLIDGEKETTIKITNRIIRISVGIQDKLFRGLVSDVSVALQDASGNVIKVWNSTGLEQTVEGLAPGEYIVILDGNKDKEQKIKVENKTELQVFRFERWTTADIGAIVAVTLIAAIIIAGVIIFMKHTRNKRTEDEE